MLSHLGISFVVFGKNIGRMASIAVRKFGEEGRCDGSR